MPHRPHAAPPRAPSKRGPVEIEALHALHDHQQVFDPAAAADIMVGPATPDSDRIFADAERAKGQAARVAGVPRGSCPWFGGAAEGWWKEGYDGLTPAGAVPLSV